MNKQFEPLFTPYDAWLWAHPPVYAIANGGLGAIRAKTTVFIVSKCKGLLQNESGATAPFSVEKWFCAVFWRTNCKKVCHQKGKMVQQSWASRVRRGPVFCIFRL